MTLARGKSVAQLFRPPRDADWSQYLRAPASHGLRCSTIHEAKGREYEAVCVVLKPDRAPENRTSHLFEAWESRTDMEPKRVVYVGVTRARRFVMLAVPVGFSQRCDAILHSGKVPTERVELAAQESGSLEGARAQ
jgi:superfamily I DNA/RNA helicase